MSRRWTRRELRDKNLVSAKGFNREYDQIKGILNGGVDRTATLNGWATRERILDNALHTTVLTENVAMAPSYLTSGNSGFMFDALTYDNFAGGWLLNSSVTTTGLKEGMVHLEFSCFAWFNDALSTANNKGVKFQLTWNGTVVAETGYYYQPWPNPYMVADFPISGDGTLSLFFAYPQPLPDSDTTTGNVAQLFFGGGQLLFINTVR